MFNYNQMSKIDMYYNVRKEAFALIFIFPLIFTLLINTIADFRFGVVFIYLLWIFTNLGITHLWIKRQLITYNEYKTNFIEI